jgi:hypothetical protein
VEAEQILSDNELQTRVCSKSKLFLEPRSQPRNMKVSTVCQMKVRTYRSRRSEDHILGELQRTQIVFYAVHDDAKFEDCAKLNRQLV